MKKILKVAYLVVLSISVVIVTVNGYINTYSRKYLFDKVSDLPTTSAGLVLGTNKYLKNGGINRYFSGRTNMAARLFHEGKVKQIVVSGYAENRYYNEPVSIKKELVKLGVPNGSIILDTLGSRTIKSIKNIEVLFPGDSVTIISQKFHNQRAVFLAREHSIKAFGYNVPDKLTKNNYRTYIREIFAKTIAFFEVVFS